jgi:hypothetical protein
VDVLQPGNPLGGGGEQDPLPVLGRGEAEAYGEVGLAGAGRAEEDDVAGLGQVGAGGQRGELGSRGGLETEVEFADGLDRREPGCPDPQVRA